MENILKKFVESDRGSQRFWGDESTYTARNTNNLNKIATGRLKTLSDNLRVHGQYEVLIKARQAKVAIVEFVKSCGFDNEGLAVALDNQLHCFNLCRQKFRCQCFHCSCFESVQR